MHPLKLLLAAALLVGCAGPKARKPTPLRPATPQEAAARIKATYDKKLDRLAPKIRAHYAIRVYRATGDTSYVRHIHPYARATVARLKRHLGHWDEPGYAARHGDSILAKFPPSRKNARRVEILKRHPEHVFYREALELFFQMKSLGLEDELGPAGDELTRRMKLVRWEELLLDSATIREYASKLANYVYYLKLLGIADLEDRYTAAFRAAFPPGREKEMDKLAYQNMIYGMTHFVLAGSGYLQQYPEAGKYAWILDYFDAHIDEILKRSKEDVVAEVGLCFKLCGKPDHRVVALTQAKLLKAFDAKRDIIPPPGGRKKKRKVKVRLGPSEHRNVMAWLLMGDFQDLRPGPHIRKLPPAKP